MNGKNEGKFPGFVLVFPAAEMRSYLAIFGCAIRS
jgi:hypothetical protein